MGYVTCAMFTALLVSQVSAELFFPGDTVELAKLGDGYDDDHVRIIEVRHTSRTYQVRLVSKSGEMMRNSSAFPVRHAEVCNRVPGKVVIRGLEARPQYNGLEAKVLRYNASSDQYLVKITTDGARFYVKPFNLDPGDHGRRRLSSSVSNLVQRMEDVSEYQRI